MTYYYHCRLLPPSQRFEVKFLLKETKKVRYCRQRYFMFSASSTTKSTLYEPLTILTSNHSGG